MEKVNCLRCRFRHEDNGNCTAVGGFCTAVSAAHCPLLREYLDTGLPPDICAEYRKFEDEIVASGKTFNHLIELLRAEKEGRVVVLPVRPVLTQSIESMLYIVEDGEIIEDSLYEACIGMASSGKTNVVYTTLGDQVIFEQADIGKTVFLAHEEAEKALKSGENDNG